MGLEPGRAPAAGGGEPRASVPSRTGEERVPRRAEARPPAPPCSPSSCPRKDRGSRERPRDPDIGAGAGSCGGPGGLRSRRKTVPPNENREVAPGLRGCRGRGVLLPSRRPSLKPGREGARPATAPPRLPPPLRGPAAPRPAPPRPRCPPRPPPRRARRGRRAAQAGPQWARLRGRGGCRWGSRAHPELWARPDFSAAASCASSAGSGTMFSPDFREKKIKPVIPADARRPA